MKSTFAWSIPLLAGGVIFGLLAVSCSENNPSQNSSTPSALTTAAPPPIQQKALPSGLLGEPGILGSNRGVMQTSSNLATDGTGYAPATGVPDNLAGQTPAPSASGTTPTGLGASAPMPSVPREQPINIPKDAVWTLFCATFPGEGGATRAAQVKDELVRATGLRDFYIVQRDVEVPVRVPVPGGLPGETREVTEVVPQTNLYYGFYKDISVKTAEGQKSHADRAFVAGLTDSEGQHPLDACIFMQLEPPDPATPADWNLVNKDADKPDTDPTKSYWSIEIAAYRGSPERKQMAVDSVKAARAMGIEAYYYHGGSTSSVCIGSWPRIAVKEGNTHSDEASTNDPDALIVVMNKALPAGTSNTLTTKDGQKVTPFVTRADIVDESLKRALMAYPEHAVNGENILRVVTDRATRKMVTKPEPSVLVVIPRKAAINSRFGGVATDTNPNAPRTINGSRSLIETLQLPDTSSTPGAGAPPPQRLRSIGD